MTETRRANWRQQPTSLRRVYFSAMRGSVRNNASAFGYSLMITTSFGLVNTFAGSSGLLRIFLFLFGAATAFIAVEAYVSGGFRRRVGSEPSNIVVLTGAMNLLAVAAGASAAAASAQLPGIASWAVGGFAATLVYLLVDGVDVLLARLTAERTEESADRPN